MTAATFRLDDLVEFIRNGLSISNRNGVGGIPITRIETISEHAVDPKRVGYAGVQLGERDDWLLERGDILFSHINSVSHLGKVALYEGRPEHLLHGMNLLGIRPKASIVLPQYLVRALRSASFRAQLVKHIKPAVNQASVSISALKTLMLWIPDFAEQRKIVDLLERADSIRRKRKEAIALTEDLLRSVFLEMFGDPVTNQKGWPVKPLRELGRVTTGKTPPSAADGMFGGPVPFVTPGDLESREPVKRTLSEAGARESRIVRTGAALVCCIGTVGKMSKAARASAFNQQINAIEWGGQVDDDYGIAALRLLKERIASLASSTTLPILNKSSFERLGLPIPPVAQQRVFASRVAAIEKTNAALNESIVEADTLFSTLVARAFSDGLEATR